jgi:hypothetical protein
LLLALVGMHLAAIAFYLLVKKENLVTPMLNGIKQLPQGANVPALHTQKTWLALLILGCAAVGVWALAMFA